MPSHAAHSSTVSGFVVDPSGARVAGATVQLASSTNVAVSAATNDSGEFVLSVRPGSYDLVILAKGFSSFVRHVHVTSSGKLVVNAKLEIAAASENVEVDANDHAIGLSATDNATAVRMDENKLATLSDDDATFQQQLLAIAGANGGRAPQVYVDGFAGGQMPPKESIREVRVNENPYSAEYDQLGMGRIEITTKAGTGKWHGNLAAQGYDSPFNSRNPFLHADDQPGYYRLHLRGGISGPLDKKSSLFLNGEYYNQQNNSIINATTDAGPYSAAIPAPQLTQDYTARYDRELSANDSFTSRYEFNRVAQTNAGLSQFVLPTNAYDSGTDVHTLQIGDTHTLGAHTDLEGRFQWQRTSVAQNAISTAPTIFVSGTFTGGGNSLGINQNSTNQLMFDFKGTWSHKAHLIRFGFRSRTNRLTSLSTAGFNGTYYFPDLDSYRAKTPSQVQLTTGQSRFNVSTSDFEEFVEEEWRARKNLTLDFGFRAESQTAIPDHWDPSPHFGVAWGLWATDKHPALVVVRAGAEIYFDRFAPADLLTAVQRGSQTAQQSYTEQNPGVLDPTQKPSLGTLSADASPTTYRVASNLRSQYFIDPGIGIEAPLGKKGQISVNYTYQRGVHQFLSRNANALRADNTRPFGDAAGERYEFASLGDAHGGFLWVGGNLDVNKYFSVFGGVNKVIYHSDSSGSTTFVSNSYNIGQDASLTGWSRTMLFLGGNGKLPGKIEYSMFLFARSHGHFNITTGLDNNGDTQYNDRPTFATAASDQANVVHTAYGNFNTVPVAGETIIPMNYAKTPANVSLQVQMSRGWRFGPAATAAAGAKPAAKTPGRYELRLGVEAQNVTNTVNANAPVGVLSSPNFGKSIGSSNSFLTTSSANRTITLDMTLRF
ncbi:MAG: carboxypeptidase regulatory-like domain-containing protein [Acidobacteriaceae bacterium]|nr:carboxypeptidase regulatory-like domain-containing protein [Acidobacteriaceae bacterium]